VFAALTGGGIVWADGGDPDPQVPLVHACLYTGGRPNVEIVGANNACPAGTTPVHWPGGGGAVAGPDPEPEPQPEPPTPESSNPPPKVNKKLYKPLNLKVNKTTLVSETVGPEPPALQRELTVSCPPSNPYAIQGYGEALDGPPPETHSTHPEWKSGKYFDSGPVLSHAVGMHAWRVVYEGGVRAWTKLGPYEPFIFPPEPTTWTLKVTVECSKVGKPKKKVGK